MELPIRNPEFIALMLRQAADPAADVTEAMVAWNKVKEEQSYYVQAEMSLRKALFARFFPAPKEGVNNAPLANGWVLKGTPKVNIKVDEAVIPNVRQELAKMNLSLDPYLKTKYDLVWSAYKAVRDDEEQNKTVGPVLRTMLTFTAGAPVLEIVLPAKAKP
jgi:hypothetical protein